MNTILFGTPMIFFDYFAEDDVKESLDKHTRKQTSLVKSMRSSTITGVQLIFFGSQ